MINFAILRPRTLKNSQKLTPDSELLTKERTKAPDYER